VDNIKMDLGEIEWDAVDWIDMAQNAGKFLRGCTIGGSSRMAQLRK
jgi:hypothetical protein